MRRLQLYIGNDRVDLFKDETVSLTQTIKNVKDISKVFTEFTKTFSVPASRVNNKIFKHYYNFNISSGFDARKKADARLELNDLPFKNGKIKLEGVDLKNNLPQTYRITFFGNTINLKDVFADEELSSLEFSNNLNQEYSYANVVSDMQSSVYGAMVVPLITHTDRMFYNSSTSAHAYGNVYPHTGSGHPNGINFNQFKYAVRLQTIIEAIEDKYDLEFSDDFFSLLNDNGWATLYMWLHRKSGAVVPLQQVPTVYTLLQDLYTTNQNLNVSSVTNGAIFINAVNISGVQTWTIGSMDFNINPVNSTDVWGIQVLRDGQPILQLDNQQGQQTFSISAGQDGILNNAVYTFNFNSLTNVSFSSDQIYIRINSVRYLVESNISVPEVDDYKNLNLFQTNQNFEFNISQQMPKMKVIDFVSGLFKMFNLVAYVNNDGVIVVQELDKYYERYSDLTTGFISRVEADGGVVESPLCIDYTLDIQKEPINIDKYLDTTKSTVDVALPFKKIIFAYKGLGSFLAKKFNQLTNGGWGSMSFTLDGNIFDAPAEEYKIELPFEHFQYERLYDQANNPPTPTPVQWGYSVNEDQQPYIGAPLLFHGIIQELVLPIRILDPSTPNTGTNIFTYMIPSNSFLLDPSVNKHNIHFQNELNEYLANETGGEAIEFTNTLFESGYKTYIQDVFNLKRRLVKVTAYLPMKVYYNLKLNDLIELGQDTYKINSLTTDLTTGKTEFELLNTIL